MLAKMEVAQDVLIIMLSTQMDYVNKLALDV
jgi:hypothetical protein